MALKGVYWTFDKEPGYHLMKIKTGEYGKFSKIQEEFWELFDAVSQNSQILQLVELSDLIGAIEGYAETLGSNLDEILLMRSITKRAFKNGHRRDKNGN